MQAVPARSSFVTEPQLPAWSLEPLDQLAHNVGSTGKNAQLSNLARPTFIRHGNDKIVVLCTSSPT